MLPSISTPHQELTPSLGTAYVYLLVSRQYPGAFKLGVTKHPAMRFDALTKHFGAFDLETSSLVVVSNRRSALDLEGVLRAVFSAPAWRVKPQEVTAKRVRPLRSNGDNEWYRMGALEPMISLLLGMIEQDVTCAFHRFDLVRNIQDSEVWRKHLCNAGVQTKSRETKDLEIDAKERLEQSEANFAAVQDWMAKRSPHLVSVTPFTSDRQGNRRRTFTFRAVDMLDAALDEVDEESWEGLASACVVSYRSERGYTNMTYFGGVTVPSADASTYSVEFLITPSFAQASSNCPQLSNLLTRIVNWLDTPSLPL